MCVCVLWIGYWVLELEVWIVYRIGDIVNASNCGVSKRNCVGLRKSVIL